MFNRLAPMLKLLHQKPSKFTLPNAIAFVCAKWSRHLDNKTIIIYHCLYDPFAH